MAGEGTNLAMTGEARYDGVRSSKASLSDFEIDSLTWEALVEQVGGGVHAGYVVLFGHRAELAPQLVRQEDVLAVLGEASQVPASNMNVMVAPSFQLR